MENKAKKEFKANQEKLTEEVSQYPNKLEMFNQMKSEYETMYNDASEVIKTEDVSEMRIASHYKISLSQ